MRGLDEGAAELQIIATQDERRLVTIPLNPSFVAETGIIAVHAKASLNDDEGGLIDLRIKDTSASSGSHIRLEYDLSSDDLSLMLLEESVELNDQKRDAYIQDIYREIEKFWREAATASRTNPERLDEFMADFQYSLSMRGGSFVRPTHTEEHSSKALVGVVDKRVGAIRVLTKEPSIPWEMLYLRDPEQRVPHSQGCFLAELGLLRWNASLGYPPSQVPIDCDLAFYLIPDYPAPYTLHGTADDRALLERALQRQEARSDQEAHVRPVWFWAI